MPDIVIGLKTLDLNAVTAPMLDTRLRPHRKRVFTEDEWNFLNTRPTAELQARVACGDTLIKLLYRPEMLNMTQRQADALSSNLRFQQDAIREIIKARKE